MDVRIKFGQANAADPEDQEILTGLPDGSLRTLFETLRARHPEIETAIKSGELDQDLLRVVVNNQPLDTGRLTQFCLKDGDTVSLLRGPDRRPTSS